MDRDIRKEFNKLLRDETDAILESATILISTASNAGSEKIKKLEGKIAHVIIDEATQGMETESLIPLALAQKSVIMIGDQK